MPPLTPLQKLQSYRRAIQRETAGHGVTAHHFVVNINQAYTLWVNSFDRKERAELWRCMHLLAQDLMEATDKPCPDPEVNIYKQLERDGS